MSSLEGTDKLARRLKALALPVQGRALKDAVGKGIQPARKKWIATIYVGKRPHITYRGRVVTPGFSKRSIRMITTVNRSKTTATALLGVRREAFYAIQFIELGTSRHAAHPSLLPAFASTRSQQEKALADSLKVGIFKAAQTR